MLITMLSDYTFKNKAFQRNVEYEVTDDTAAALFAAGVARVATQADYNQNTLARIDPSTGAVLDGFGNPVSGVGKSRIAGRCDSIAVSAGMANGAPGWTSHLTMEMPRAYSLVRIGVLNAEATTLTGVTGVVAQSDGVVSFVNPSNGAWVPVTWGGASSVTLPARVSANEPSITFSDWMLCQSVARADGGVKPIVMGRVFVPSTNATFSTTNNIMTGQWTVNKIWRSRENADRVSTTAGWTNGEGSTVCLCVIETMAADRVITVMGCGDSTFQGFGSTSNGQNSWGLIAERSGGISWINAGISGQTTSTYLTRCLNQLTILKPSVAVWLLYSPNDGAPTQALADAAWGRAVQFVQACEDADVLPMIATGLPRGIPGTPTYTAAQDAIRVALNARARASGIAIFDFDAALSAGGSPATLAAGLYSDDRHPNDAGYAAAAARFITDLAAVVR